MIQIAAGCVSSVMFAAVQCAPASQEPPPFHTQPRPRLHLAWRGTRAPAEGPLDLDPAHWGRLIAAVAQRQDREAFRRLFEHFAPRVKTFLRRSGAGDGAAEELAQETMILVWRKAGQFDPATDGASAWIFTIARNQRIDALRRERRGGEHSAADIDAEFRIAQSPQPDASLAALQDERRVRAAMGRLSEDQQRVVELSFYKEQAHADIAKVLNIPLGTVKSRLRLAMARLRTLLGETS